MLSSDRKEAWHLFTLAPFYSFLSETNLPGGEYLLSLAVKTYEDLPAETRTLEIKLKGLSQN